MELYRNFDHCDTHLPPGFRFHPTDEELITFYLLKKVLDSNFTGRAIAEVDLNRCEPWELPGRAPKGAKSNWVMHEYRLEGKLAYHYLSRSSKDEWVISRVFQKTGGTNTSSSSSSNAGAKKIRMDTNISLYPEVSSPSSVSLPPLLESGSTSSFTGTTSNTTMTDRDCRSYFSQSQSEHVSCFSTIAAAASAANNYFDFTPTQHQPQQHPPFLAGDAASRFQRNAGVTEFPTLRSLQDNLQLPFYFSPPGMIPSLPPPAMQEGGAGGGSSMSWDLAKEERVDYGGGGRIAVGPTELDCMWTY
ncbi:hypothetical protein HS088_TW21G00435 [Tripterygium wilfordii]|uniref:NAC domain-containing protein n=1 Tax=Tripterygium wilfordii TaxID=458696 RepID=A0A7J7C2A7_TRIWF|nr:hypothetical protein HS088_TW21G00435 [Tripterygium wilfordii]